MQRRLVKLCSLREEIHAKWAIEAGADLYGMIFAPARRQVSLERAHDIDRAAMSTYPGAPFPVGVFVNQDVVEINDIAQSIGLSFVQLHGDETPEMVQALRSLVIKTIKPKPNETFDQLATRIDAFQKIVTPPVAYLIEGFKPDQAGGHGLLADWGMARALAERFPIILAGGLTPLNVAEAIEVVRPEGVDVSSGVETDGVKDRQKMIDFVANARSAFQKAGL